MPIVICWNCKGEGGQWGDDYPLGDPPFERFWSECRYCGGSGRLNESISHSPFKFRGPSSEKREE